MTSAAEAIWAAFKGDDLRDIVYPDNLAAAIEALADQVVPDGPDCMRMAIDDVGWWDMHDIIRDKILAIAKELRS